MLALHGSVKNMGQTFVCPNICSIAYRVMSVNGLSVIMYSFYLLHKANLFILYNIPS